MKREAHVLEHRAQTFRRPRVDREIPNGENRVRHLGEDDPRKVEGNDPVRLIHDLADAQISTDREEQIGVDRIKTMFGGEQVDHASARLPRSRHQIRPETSRHLITCAVEMTSNWTRSREARTLQIGALYQIERQFNVHLAFDGGAAHFAISLRRMRVSDREQSALDLYR